MTRTELVRRHARSLVAALAFLLGLALADRASAESLPKDLGKLSGGTVVSRIPTLSDPALTWELYLPRAFVPDRKWPVLLLFDPRGRGAVPLELFRDAADEFGWMLASSNDTRSDSATANNSRAVNGLVSDVVKRLPVDERRIHAGGFSGGGVLAWTMGLKTDWLAGMISVGGRPVPEHAALAPKCPLYAAAGTEDFNHLPTVKLDGIATKAGVPHRLVFYPGTHAWFDKRLARDAVAWLEVLAARDGKAALAPDRIEVLRLGELDTVRALEESGDLLAAARRCREIATAFSGLGEVESILKRASSLESASAYRAALKEETEAEAYEVRARRRLGEAILALRGETPPPPAATLKRTLALDETLRKAGGAGAMPAAARRVLALILVQFGSYQTQELFGLKDYHRAVPALSVAVEVAPRDPAVRYNLACAQAQSGALDAALASLGEALDNGLPQPLQMETDADLAALRGRPGFAPLLERARALEGASGR